MMAFGVTALFILGAGVLGFIYAFSPFNPFDGKGSSAGFAGMIFTFGCAILVLVGLLMLAGVGVAQLFFGA